MYNIVYVYNAVYDAHSVSSRKHFFPRTLFFLAVFFFFFSVCAGATSKHSNTLAAQREHFPRKSCVCVGVRMRDRESKFREAMEVWCLDLCLGCVTKKKKIQ